MLHSIESKTLFYLGANEKLYQWNIIVNDNIIEIQHGRYGGLLSSTYEEIKKGKGGRSLFGQVQSRVNSRINTQKLRGYKETIEEARLGRTNSLNLPKPMLAQQWNKVKNIDTEDMFVQYKYDGNRCLITRQGDEILAYSRKGKLIESIKHILDGIDMPEGMVIDGELYYHKTPVSTIRSWISRSQPDTLKLNYHAYDIIAPIPYKYRLQMLRQITFNESGGVVPTWHKSELTKSINEMMQEARTNHYEGLILRDNKTGYEIGKRSKSLIKLKDFQDAEFLIDEIYRSEKGRPMATCLTDEGLPFDVVLPGTMNEKEYYLTNREQYIGKYMTIEFSQWTPDGLPFHAVAKCFHEDV